MPILLEFRLSQESDFFETWCFPVHPSHQVRAATEPPLKAVFRAVSGSRFGDVENLLFADGGNEITLSQAGNPAKDAKLDHKSGRRGLFSRPGPGAKNPVLG
jgi:hypothetical protein